MTTDKRSTALTFFLGVGAGIVIPIIVALVYLLVVALFLQP